MNERNRQPTNKQRERVSEHKSGDHVFNKGVKRIYYDILTEYLKGNSTFCRAGMSPTATPELYNIFHRDQYWPLPRNIVCLLDEMSVSSRKKDKPDDNSIIFGEGKRCLVEGVVCFLDSVIDIIKNGDQKEKCNGPREQLRNYIQTYLTHERGVSRGGDGFYVDPEAKERWLKQRGNSEEQFRKCRDAIRKIFHKLVDAEDNDPEKWFLYILAKEILHLSTRRV